MTKMPSMRVLVTGSEGLVGTELCKRLVAAGHTVERMDIKLFHAANASIYQDVTERYDCAERVRNFSPDGVIHLAACSRVLWGEERPEQCARTNVGGTANMLHALTKGWFLFVSSREVYGNPTTFPVTEDAPRLPINTYGWTKALGEEMTFEARKREINAGVVRLSNVYGRTTDHPDRVLPAFAHAAAVGRPMHVAGSQKRFDFVHVEDAARGIQAAAAYLHSGKQLPTIHFTTGVGTTLETLAHKCNTAAKRLGLPGAEIRARDVKGYEVNGCVGDNARANDVLGWQPRVAIDDGIEMMVAAYGGVTLDDAAGLASAS